MNIKSNIHTVENKRVIGKDTAHIIFFIPTKRAPNLKEAIDNAIEKKSGVVGLADVTLKRGFWYIPGLYGKDYYVVEGNPIIEK
ncbi:MAG: hypothetical protein GY817_08885 [bacterium]|nr:hypothetical protein [bacterium]